MNENTTELTIKALQNGQVTKEQYERLELFITHSPFATIRAKKALLYFLRESDYLKRSIVMTIPFIKDGTDEADFSLEVSNAVHDMSGSRCFPNLYDIFNFMGISKYMYHHGGIAKKITDNLISFETGWDGAKQETVPIDYYGYTIWLSKKPYARDAKLIQFDLKKIQETKLRKMTSYFAGTMLNGVEFYDENMFPSEFHTAGREKATTA